jgi:hypothetical protein
MHNMSDDPKEVSLPDGIVVDERLFSNLAELDKQVDTAKQSDSSEQSIDGASIRLEPWESVVWSVE